MSARPVVLATLAASGCLLQDNPDYDEACGDGRFAFAVIADATMPEALPRVLSDIAARREVHAVFGAGDLVPMSDVQAAIEAAPAPTGECAPSALAWFPAMGAAELAQPDELSWWAQTRATGWPDDPAASPLATQLAAIQSFSAGPTTNDGTVYAFEYLGVHFTVLDLYESGGPGIVDGSPQHAWLDEELQRTDASTRMVIGHVPIAPACYDAGELCHHAPPACPYELPWSDPGDDPPTDALALTFAEHDVTAYLHGRDNVPGRRLVDGSGAVVFDRLVFDVFDACATTIDPIGNPADWEDKQAQPGRFWQVDVGAVAIDLGSYAIVTVTTESVLFELFAYLEGDDVLFDSWSVPR
jgi:hypothetical protein